MSKKIIKFEAKKTGKTNRITRAVSVKTEKKRMKLLPVITLDYFKKKRGKKDD